MSEEIIIEREVSLTPYSTLHIGGNARCFTTVKTFDHLRQAFQYAHQHSLPFLIIGRGSNTLFDDRGYSGLVILNKIDFTEGLDSAPSDEESIVVRAGGGASFSRLGIQTARNGWGGLEFASGIPGSVGGAVFMNAGANGHDVAAVVRSVEFMTPDGEITLYTREQLSFSYRSSPFQQMIGAVIAATFTLKRSSSSRETQKAMLSYRTDTQPYGQKSAGCAFRNPPEIAAGALIDQLGLKGLTVGGAAVSTQHGNFLINTGEATSADMRALIDTIQQKAAAAGVSLDTEWRTIPYDEDPHAS